MSTIEDALYYTLANDPSVSALASTYVAGDVPQNAAATRVTYQKISDVPTRHQGGKSSLDQARFQVNCYGANLSEAQAIATAVRTALEDVSGAFGEAGSTVDVPRIVLESQRHDFWQPADASERGGHIIIMDFMVWHRL